MLNWCAHLIKRSVVRHVIVGKVGQSRRVGVEAGVEEALAVVVAHQMLPTGRDGQQRLVGPRHHRRLRPPDGVGGDEIVFNREDHRRINAVGQLILSLRLHIEPGVGAGLPAPETGQARSRDRNIDRLAPVGRRQERRAGAGDDVGRCK